MRGNYIRAAALALLLCVYGCAPGMRSFRASGPGLSDGATIAFLPITNLTTREEAPVLLTQKLLVELGRATGFQVQDPGIVTGALRQLRVLDPDRMTAEQMGALSVATGASCFLAGVITDWREGKDAPKGVPIVAVSLRVIDASNGAVLWAATSSREGDDGESFFGLGRIRTVDRLAGTIARDLADSMRRLGEQGPAVRLARRDRSSALKHAGQGEASGQ